MTLLSLATLGLAASVEGPEEEPFSQQVVRRLEEAWPEPLLEEEIGLTGMLVGSMEVIDAMKFLRRISHSDQVERFVEWMRTWPYGTGIFRVVTQDRKVHPDILEFLSRSDVHELRKGVAGNPSTTSDVLVRLAGHGEWNWSVREEAMRNPSLPMETLKSIFEDEEETNPARKFAKLVYSGRGYAAEQEGDEP